MVSFLYDGVDDILCGCITVCFSGFFLALYIIILFVLRRRRDKFNTPVYTQMFFMGITDCIQLGLHLFGGICSLAQYDMPYVLNMILGGFANSAWFAWIIFSFSVAFNRFIAFCYPKYHTIFYSKHLLRLQLCVCWLVMLIMLSVYLSPYCSILYYRYNFAWRYDHTTPGEPTVARIELIYVTTLLSFSGISYLCIFVKIILIQKDSKTRSDKRHEIRVLIQAACVCCYTILSQLHWQFYSFYMPANRYSVFSCNFAWILNSGTTPILCLTINKTIQRAVLQFLHITTVNSTVIVTIAPTLHSSRRH